MPWLFDRNSPKNARRKNFCSKHTLSPLFLHHDMNLHPRLLLLISRTKCSPTCQFQAALRSHGCCLSLCTFQRRSNGSTSQIELSRDRFAGYSVLYSRQLQPGGSRIIPSAASNARGLTSDPRLVKRGGSVVVRLCHSSSWLNSRFLQRVSPS